MTSTQLLKQLDSARVRVALNGDSIDFDGPPGWQTPELVVELKRHKQEILKTLRAPKAGSAANPIVVRVRSQRFLLCPLDDCLKYQIEVNAGKDDLYYCNKCRNWFKRAIWDPSLDTLFSGR
jgi:hypothetical protein